MSTVTETVLIDFVYEEATNVNTVARQVWHHYRESDEPIRISDLEGARMEGSFETFVLTSKASDISLMTHVEAFEPDDDDRSWTVPALPALEQRVGIDDLQYGDPADRIDELLSLVRGIYRASDSRPCYCYGLDPYHTEAVGDILDVPVTAAGLRDGRIDDVSWLMLFPPRLVESYGREWLRSAPVYRAIDLEDGGLLLVAIDDPWDPDSAELTDLREYFGVEPLP